MIRKKKLGTIKPEIWWMWAGPYQENDLPVFWPAEGATKTREDLELLGNPFDGAIPVRVLLTPVVAKEKT